MVNKFFPFTDSVRYDAIAIKKAPKFFQVSQDERIDASLERALLVYFFFKKIHLLF